MVGDKGLETGSSLIMLYEFTKLRLTEDEVCKFVFMNPSPAWTDKPDEHEFLLSICRRTLKEVVGKVIEKSSFQKYRCGC